MRHPEPHDPMTVFLHFLDAYDFDEASYLERLVAFRSRVAVIRVFTEFHGEWQDRGDGVFSSQEEVRDFLELLVPGVVVTFEDDEENPVEFETACSEELPGLYLVS